MNYGLKEHDLLRYFYRKYGITQISQVKKVNSDKAQVSNALSGKNNRVLRDLVNVFLEDYGEKEGVSYEDFFPPEQSLEARIEEIHANQKRILKLLNELKSDGGSIKET